MRSHTESVDDYLKAILELGEGTESPVAGGALAAHLRVRAASVTGMLQKLAGLRPPLVRYEKHRGARLTRAGARRALEIIRHHRLIERFLHDVLDYGWDEVHDEAERLEHFISERLEERMAAKLGNPDTDPHGHPIPTRRGKLPARASVLLSQWACGVPARISSVSDRDPVALRALRRLALRPGVVLTVQPGVRGAAFWVQTRAGGKPKRLSPVFAAAISVVPVGSPIISKVGVAGGK